MFPVSVSNIGTTLAFQCDSINRQCIGIKQLRYTEFNRCMGLVVENATAERGLGFDSQVGQKE